MIIWRKCEKVVVTYVLDTVGDTQVITATANNLSGQDDRATTARRGRDVDDRVDVRAGDTKSGIGLRDDVGASHAGSGIDIVVGIVGLLVDDGFTTGDGDDNGVIIGNVVAVDIAVVLRRGASTVESSSICHLGGDGARS